jgi:hypothetical protein
LEGNTEVDNEDEQKVGNGGMRSIATAGIVVDRDERGGKIDVAVGSEEGEERTKGVGVSSMTGSRWRFPLQYD